MKTENKAGSGRTVLAAASAKEKKYYLDPAFATLPVSVQEELKKVCVPLAEEFNQNVVLFFDPDGTLLIGTEPPESTSITRPAPSKQSMSNSRASSRSV